LYSIATKSAIEELFFSIVQKNLHHAIDKKTKKSQADEHYKAKMIWRKPTPDENKNIRKIKIKDIKN